MKYHMGIKILKCTEKDLKLWELFITKFANIAAIRKSTNEVMKSFYKYQNHRLHWSTNFFLKNALNLVFWLISSNFGLLIESPKPVFWVSGQNFAVLPVLWFSGLKNQILEIFKNLANILLKISNIFLMTIKLWTICEKKWKSPHWFRRYCLPKFEKTTKFENFWNFSQNFLP